MEFGVSPFPESRRAMIGRAVLFDVPAYKWVPARKSISAEYKLFLLPADSIDSAELAVSRGVKV
jgi:hypothetical protein